MQPLSSEEDQSILSVYASAKCQCVYKSQWLPCEYCRLHKIEEPCNKLPAPSMHQGIRLPVAFSISDMGGVSLTSEDAMILQYGYSNEYHANFSVEPAFFRVLASQYTKAIQSPALRYAILASVAEWVSSDLSTTYLLKARRILGNKLLHPQNVDEADLFAAYLLCLYLPYGTSEAARHLNGCLAIYNFLLRKYPTPSPMLSVYGLFVHEQVVDWLNIERLSTPCADISWSAVDLECLSFDRKIKYSAHFSCQNWPTYDIAAFTTLAAQVNVLRSLVVQVLIRQANGTVETNFDIALAVEQTKYHFYNQNLRQFVTVAEEICDEALRRGKLKNFILLAAITCYTLCIQIELICLENPSVVGGLFSLGAKYCSAKIATYLEVFGVGMPIYVTPVLFAGLALPDGDSSSCTSKMWLRFLILDSSLFLKQLEFIGYKNEAENLWNFWKSPTVRSLQNVFS